MSLQAWIGVFLAVGLAVSGYVFKHVHELAMRRRQERLSLVNEQIHRLYGPLYILTRVGGHLLRNQIRHSPFGFFKDPENKAPDEIRVWLNWYKHVAKPINDKLENTILENAHLLIEGEMHECLLNLLAHISSYRLLELWWENEDFSETRPDVPFPTNLNEYAERSYQDLKRKQLTLIRYLGDRS